MIQRIVASLAALALFAWTGTGYAAGLTPESYLQAEIAAREATLAAMEERLTLLRAGGDRRAETAALAKSQAAVDAAFGKYGTTARAHSAYAATHSEEIAAWLAAHPDWEFRLLMLQDRFMGLVGAFESLRGR